jgi:serine/threonine protein kinase
MLVSFVYLSRRKRDGRLYAVKKLKKKEMIEKNMVEQGFLIKVLLLYLVGPNFFK